MASRRHALAARVNDDRLRSIASFIGIPGLTRDDTLDRIHYESERFRRKLEGALALVYAALRQSRQPYVAFSTGKDSVATLALVDVVCHGGVDLLWTDDELEYPETVAYIQRLQAVSGLRLTLKTGGTQHAGWFTPWSDAPYWRDPLPGTLNASHVRADDLMAEMGYDLTFTGVRMGESRRRRDWLVQTAANGIAGLYQVGSGTGLRCCPLWDWTEDDVWALIGGWRLPYNLAYDRLEEIGVPRTSQRIGPLPLTPRRILEAGWPELLTRLEGRYGSQWS